MKAVKITLAGRTQYLAYTGEAMFQLQEKFGTAAELLGAIGKNTRDGLSVACEAAAILAEQGELARRHLGYDKGPIIEAATIRATITPSEIAALKLAIPAGYGARLWPGSRRRKRRDRPRPRRTETRKKNDVTRAHYGRIAALCGVSRKEALLMPPGELFDMMGAMAPGPWQKGRSGRLKGAAA